MKKLNKKRLFKLIFWIVHIISVSAIILGFLYLINSKKTEQSLLQNYNQCYANLASTPASDKIAFCSSDLHQISVYNSTMFNSFVIGILILLAYWIPRWLYRYLFTEE